MSDRHVRERNAGFRDSARLKSILKIVRQWGTRALDRVIIETTVFTRQVLNLLSDRAYRELQVTLAQRPDAGDLIKGGGGLRKLRCMIEGRGKRGGIRVIYYWAVRQDQVLFLLMYAKNERDDLTANQLKKLRTIIEAEYP
jgi:hypothetical protein